MTKTCPKCGGEINLAACVFAGVWFDEHSGKIVLEIECDRCGEIAFTGYLDPAEMDAQT